MSHPQNESTVEPVTLGADIGGHDAFVATHDLILLLRGLLKQYCRRPYSAALQEVALVYRIDGSVQAWGKKGVETVRFYKERAYVTADIFMPADSWANLEVAKVRKNLAAGITDAVHAIVEGAVRRSIEIESARLRREVGEVTLLFLNSGT
jgi:hypothetical protein